MASYDRMLNEHTLRERDHCQQQLIDTSGVAEGGEAARHKYLASEERAFIQKFCIDAIMLKKQERVTKSVKTEVKEEAKAPEGFLEALEGQDGSSREADDEDEHQPEEVKAIAA